MFIIRRMEMTQKDVDFLTDMLYESIYIPVDKPPKDELLQAENLRKYHQQWGRKGDMALLAVNQQNQSVGAVWYRLFNGNEKGYGFVSSNIPELGIAIVEGERGKGLGKQLLREIIKEAKRAGYIGLSLSVDLKNTSAISFYHQLGFADKDVAGTSKTMLCSF
ncbi:GNAT family N-acetyltransferase [Oceanobacillus sojae]|uniref:GNAT family N-acetyltransferase n=1 Tax=Oceanobacillus sojae TaxID=582851 RepID=UPI0021A4801E|nr:GNAT family N-acetyltransferase [Oceanobacillus sojae]MCT1904301.1 GNAT family N-acetyltransferase [Oceanobacillus sojae]